MGYYFLIFNHLKIELNEDDWKLIKKYYWYLLVDYELKFRRISLIFEDEMAESNYGNVDRNHFFMDFIDSIFL